MKRKRIKGMLVLGAYVLSMQRVSTPMGMVYAETIPSQEELSEQVESITLPNLLESTEKTDPKFLFKQSHMQGTANELINVIMFSDQEVSEVRVRLPEEAQVIKDQLPGGISMEQDKQSKEWVIQAQNAQNTVVFTLVFESEGSYDLSTKDTTATIEISNDEGTTGENVLEESSITPENEFSESSLNTNEKKETKDNVLEETNTNQENLNTRSSVNVSTWAQYAAAINNQSVTTINVTANISGNTTLDRINRDLTINGNGFTINSQEQRYRLTGADRQLTVRNATITGTLLGNSAQFRSVSGASNTRFIFSDIVFRGENRILDTPEGATDIKQSVVFDGGNSSFPYTNYSGPVFLNVSDFRIINQASIEVDGKQFNNTTTSFVTELRDSMTFFIEKGSSLSVINSNGSNSNGIVASTVNIEGELNLSTLGTTITGPNSATVPNKIMFGENSKVSLERIEGTGGVLNLVRGGELTIAKGAEFDLVHQSNGPVINSSTAQSFLNVDSERLALWDRGLQNEEKASMVFSDIALKLGGLNGSEIISTNNERFERLYDSTGLTSYSRMSNRDVEEMNRSVHVRYENKEGESIEDDETLTGFLGDSYQSAEKEIPGYQLIALPENKSGEFTREVIKVTYVYERSYVSPVDPLDPEIEVDPENKPELPENQGQLSIDFVSSFNFGTQAISAHDQTYYAKPQRLLNEDGTVNEVEERPNYVQISDRRPETARHGWQLAVTQRGEFEGADGQVLAGARLRLMNQQVASAQGGDEPHLQQTNPLTLVPNVRRVLLYAQGDEGTGTWVYRFGNSETAGESVALDVPKGANPEATHYKATLLWELSAVPEN